MHDEIEQFTNYVASLSHEAMSNLLLKLHSSLANARRDRRDAWRRVREATQEERDAQEKLRVLNAYLLAYRSGKVVEITRPASEQSSARRKQA